MTERSKTSLLTAIALLAGATAGEAQIALRSSVIASGGGKAGGSTVTINATIGQGVIGPVFSSTQRAQQGFWYMPAPPVPASAPAGEASAATALRAEPNPFSTEATLHLEIPRAGRVMLTLHDALGREVRTLADGVYEAGPLAVRLDGAGLPSGMYTAHMVAGTLRRSINVIVTK